MALYKIGDFHPNYRTEIFEQKDIKGNPVYAGGIDSRGDKIGTVSDMLIDETGRIRYLVIDTGFWVFGKKVLLPIGRCSIDSRHDSVYAIGLTSKRQVENLPEYHDSMTVDYDYEEQVRGVYRMPSVENSAPVEMTPPVEASEMQAVSYRQPVYDRHTYSYEQEPELYQVTEQNHGVIKLYEERLVASKNRRKAGEVRVGKHVETETEEAFVPVEKEQVVIERHPTNTEVTTGQADFHEGEVERMELYEETADIDKEAVLREEVNVNKSVRTDTVETRETLRHEELDIETTGNPIIEEDRRRVK